MSKFKNKIEGSWPFVAPTPIGPGWGWGSRLIEVATTPLGIVFWTCVWIGRAFQWPFDRLVNGKPERDWREGKVFRDGEWVDP